MIPDGYDVVDQISRTPTAQVWRAMNPHGELVALKIAADDERVERRFKREIEAMSAAAGPHTMPILAFDETYRWYAMPLADHTLWDAGAPSSLESLVEVAEAVAIALGPIHAAGQVHRDLKPQNVLRLGDGDDVRWVVADFGIVRNAPGLTTQQLTREDGLTGSEGWAAPEQYREAHIATITADVYALGGILSWMVTGNRPSFGSVALPTDNPRLRAVIKRATNSDPRARYANLNELVQALKSASTESTQTFAGLASKGAWGEAGDFISAHPNLVDRYVADLPRLSGTEVRAWTTTNPAGLGTAIVEVADLVLADYSDLAFSAIDDLLSWSVKVLRELIRAREYEIAENVAASVFAATSGIGQWKPAVQMLDWMNTLDAQAQAAMRGALHSSDSWGFFARQASNRWQSRGDSDLVRDLRAG